MSIDEPETPRVYQNEGNDVAARCYPYFARAQTDIVDDDKVDVSRMAEDEVTAKNHANSHTSSSISVGKKTATVSSDASNDLLPCAGRTVKADSVSSHESSILSTSKIAPIDPAPSTLSSASSSSTGLKIGTVTEAPLQSLASSNISGIVRNTMSTTAMLENTTASTTVNGHGAAPTVQQQSHEGIKTAFNPVNHSSLFFPGHTVAQQMLHSLSQQYYNGLLFSGSLPFVSPSPANGLTSALISPLHGVGVYSPNAWLSTPAIDASKAALYTPMPLVGWPVSPNFAPQFDTNQINAALQNMSRMQQSPMFQPSPFQSPNTGALIVPLASKVPAPTQCPTLDAPSSAPLILNSGSSSSLSGAAHHHSVVPCSSASSGYSVDPKVNAEIVMTSSLTPNRRIPPHDNDLGSVDAPGVTSLRQPPKSTLRIGGTDGRHRQKDAIRRTEVDICHSTASTNVDVGRTNGVTSSDRTNFSLQSPSCQWHSLTREDQQKYYDMARRVRQEHLQKYPGWSARDNYAIHKKKKRKRETGQGGLAIMVAWIIEMCEVDGKINDCIIKRKKFNWIPAVLQNEIGLSLNFS